MQNRVQQCPSLSWLGRPLWGSVAAVLNVDDPSRCRMKGLGMTAAADILFLGTVFNIPECCRPSNFCFPRGVHTDDDELTKCVLLPLFIPVAAARLVWLRLVFAFIIVLNVPTCIMLEVTERGLVWQKQLFNKRTSYDSYTSSLTNNMSSATHVFVFQKRMGHMFGGSRSSW